MVQANKSVFTTELPLLTFEGEVFNLEGDGFSKGAKGQVVNIISQSGGYTKVVLAILDGVMNHARRVNRKRSQQAKITDEDRQYVPYVHQDVSVSEHNTVIDPHAISPQEHIDQNGSIVMVNKNMETISQNTQQGLEASIDDYEFGSIPGVSVEFSTSAAPPNINVAQPVVNSHQAAPETLSDILNVLLKKNDNSQESSGNKEFISQESHIEMMGNQVNNVVGCVGGLRKKQYMK